MESKQLIDLIRDPGKLDKNTADQLKKTVEEYPYFQSGLFLYLKNLKVINDNNFKNRFQDQLIQINNKRKLFDYLDLFPRTQKEETTSYSSGATVDFEEEEIHTSTEQTKETEANEKEIKETAGEKEESQDPQEIIKSRLQEINRNNEEEEEKEIKEKQEEKKETHKTKTASETKQAYPNKNTSSNDDLLELDEDLSAENQQAASDQPTDQQKNTGESKKDKPEQAKADAEQKTKKAGAPKTPIENYALYNLEEAPVDEKEPEDKKDELIDHFIKEQPRIKPKKDVDRQDIPPASGKEGAKNKDISSGSVKESEEYMTETLAKIYTGQGYYSKAIFIYEKLSLKYPEKSSYFADQIEQIKKKMNK